MNCKVFSINVTKSRVNKRTKQLSSPALARRKTKLLKPSLFDTKKRLTKRRVVDKSFWTLKLKLQRLIDNINWKSRITLQLHNRLSSTKSFIAGFSQTTVLQVLQRHIQFSQSVL